MKDLIKYCRYYKGEDEIPLEISKNGDGMFWFYEKLWVEREDLHGDDTRNMIEYIRSGLEDFRKEDDVPITLKALLFNRHSHWGGGYGTDEDVKYFKEWYFKYYLKEACEASDLTSGVNG